MATDITKVGRPTGTHKQDYVLYTGGGFGGGTGLTVAGTQRQSWFIDLSKFDAKVLRLIMQNFSWQIFQDSGGVTPAQQYFGFSNSNDRPLNDIIASAAAAGLQIPGATIPPYNLEAANIPQPFGVFDLHNPFQSNDGLYCDQGLYLYDLGTIGWLYPINSDYTYKQTFVPMSDRLQRIDISGLVNDAVGDHLQYSNVLFQLYDFNNNLIYSQTISKFANPLPGSSPFLTVPYIDSEYDTTADDGLSYWTELYGVKLEPAANIALVPGQTYYFTLSKSSVTTQNYYLSSNAINNSGAPNPINQYPFGQLYYSFRGGAWTALSTGLCAGFCTMRPTPRLCLTSCWDSPGYYWHAPSAAGGQVKTLKLDTEKVI